MPVEDVRGADIVRLAAPDHARVVAIYRPAMPMAPPATPQTMPSSAPPGPLPGPPPPPLHLEAGVPGFFNLAEDRPQTVELNVRQGGLYRVETLGRLHTRGAIGTDFVPQLETGDANGIGQNMLLQGWLRAGRYHVNVTATDSAGHAGVQAAPAPLRTAASLIPGGSVRAALPAGTGLLVPIIISTAGSYKLDLIGLARQFTARLEDAEGWPLMASSQFSVFTQDLAPGDYRLLVKPEAVDTQLVSRLTLVTKPVALTGHGPFPLPFGTVSYTWREPPGRNDSRLPDAWSFALAGPSDVSITLTDGMEAMLLSASGAQVAHIVGLIPYEGHLAPGAYRIEARSQGRNDRLDYQIGLSSTQLQPATPRDVLLPSQQHFALGAAQVVNLTSFGAVPVQAILRDAAGHLLGRYGARDDEWNIALSRLLPAGSYTLDLASAAPPPQTHTHRNVNDAASAQDNNAENNDEADAEPAQTTGEATAQDEGDAPEPFPARDDAPDSDSQNPAGHTELTLLLPPESPPVQLTHQTMTLTGGGVHDLLLPAAKPDTLLLAGAASSATLQVSLDRQDETGWHSVAAAQGLAPIAAVPVAETGSAWRLSVWAVDPGAPEIHVAAQLTSLPSQVPTHTLRLTPTPLPGVRPDLAVARILTPNRAMLALAGPAEGVAVASWPGHAMTVPNGGLVAPQADAVWVVAAANATIGLDTLPAGRPVALTLAAGARAALPHQPAPFTAWVAEAAGQPGLAGGHGMGVAAGSAMALITPGGATLSTTLWSASNDDDLRITASPVALRETDTAGPGALQNLAPTSVTRVALPDTGVHRLRLDLPPGSAAVADGGQGDAVTVWTGHQAVSRTLEGAWREVWLVNTSARAAPASLAVDDIAAAEAITPDHAMKRFFGAGGSADVAVAGRPGQTLVVAGAESATFIGADGTVQRGTGLTLSGPGRLILQHSTGLVAAWLEGQGAAPWPVSDAVTVTLPATLKMSGPAMRLDLAPATPVVLRIRGSAPAILALNDQPPSLFPAGAADSVYLPAGPAHVRIISPQDGPLSGTIELTATPVHPAAEGLGAVVAVAPGDALAFSFTLRQAARIGVGVRAEPDRALLYLLNAHGQCLATGAALLRDLPAGDYVLLTAVPPDAPTTTIQPALIGLTPHPNGPPPDTVDYYRKLSGLTRKDAVQ